VTDENLTPEEEPTPVEPSADAEPNADAEPVETPSPAAPAEPVAEAPAEAPAAEEIADEPAAEQPAHRDPAPVAEEPVQAVPAAAGPPEPDRAAPAAGESTAPAAGESVEVDVEFIEEDDDATPRVKPAIPGLDLMPDLVADGDQYLDAEARAAAEAEAEEAALRAAAGEDPDADTKPIADAAINLAADARYMATGKRKTAVARVILKPGTGVYLINGKTIDDFFPRDTLQRTIRNPLEAVGYETRMDVVARMHGGGVSAQAGALRHGISRALLEADPNLRGELKRRGFLTRDPRVKERKKAGLKKARKKPQFSKR
jgi:small subunit ribosomal protein S9